MLVVPIAFLECRSILCVMKTVLAATLVLLVLYGALGAVHTSATGGELMGGCPFMPGVNLCDMTPIAHLSAWESSFIALAAQSVGVLLVLALLALLYVSLSPAPILRMAFVPLSRTPTRVLPARHELQDALSDGTLNSKVF